MKRLAVGMIGAMLLAATAGAMPVLAQTPLRDRCVDGDLTGLTSDRIIEACTGIIDAPDTSPRDRADAFFSRGRALRFIDRRRALADFGHAIALDPAEARPFVARGTLYLGMRDFDLAIADYTQAARLEERDIQILYLRALAYARKGAYENAMADYDRAIRLQPIWSKAYQARGATYTSMREYERAMADFELAVKFGKDDRLGLDYPSVAAARSGRCMVGVIRGQFERAAPDCNEAARQYAAGFEKRNLPPMRLGNADFYTDAIDDVERTDRARHADALFGRGIARLRGGDRTGGDADMVAALALEPGTAERYARHGVRP